jgi:nucleoside-diphosphate-sugar epimerase
MQIPAREKITMGRLVVGCGYIGGRVARLWQAEGHRVRAVTRKLDHADQLRQLGMEPIKADVTDLASLRQLPRVSTVFHGVGLDRTAGQSMRRVYVDGLRNLLDALPRPDRFIYISSTSVYGQADGEEVDEHSLADPQEESGRICLEAEQLLHRRLPEAIILRFAGIYGPGRLLRRAAIEQGQPIAADPDRWVNLIHGDDGAAAVLAAEARGQPGRIYNVSDGRPVRRRDLFVELAKRLGAPEPRFVPPPADKPHERGHRRVSNRRMREELQVTLKYPTYVEGLAASVGS